MKYFIIFSVLLYLGCVFTKNAEISYGVIFFENSYFQGDYLMSKTSHISAKCVNLPIQWWGRVSSVSTTGCVVLYTDENCNSKRKPEIFSSIRLEFNQEYLSEPNKISNKNFGGTWLNKKVKAFRSCTLAEEIFSVLNLRKNLI